MSDLRDHLRELIGGLLRPASVYMGGYWSALHPGERRSVDATIDEILPAIRRAALEEAAHFVATHRVAHVNRPPFRMVVGNDSVAASEPDVAQRALAAAIRALKDNLS